MPQKDYSGGGNEDQQKRAGYGGQIAQPDPEGISLIRLITIARL